MDSLKHSHSFSRAPACEFFEGGGFYGQQEAALSQREGWQTLSSDFSLLRAGNIVVCKTYPNCKDFLFTAKQHPA
jgi:hypothetical protein